MRDLILHHLPLTLAFAGPMIYRPQRPERRRRDLPPVLAFVLLLGTVAYSTYTIDRLMKGK